MRKLDYSNIFKLELFIMYILFFLNLLFIKKSIFQQGARKLLLKIGQNVFQNYAAFLLFKIGSQ